MTTLLLVLLMALFLHPFVIYPLALRLVPSRRRRDPAAPIEPPTVAFVVCALNEERVIRQKLENMMQTDYPRGRIAFYLVNDGSTDRTSAIAHEFDGRVTVIDRDSRRGKVTNLNEVIAGLDQEIVLLSDANVIYRPDAVARLVARFADPTVGCVSGKVVLGDTTQALRGGEENFYSLEWFLQEKASEIYSMCGCDGAMHAFRRKLFTACPPDTLIEDYVQAMQVVAQGHRTVYEPSAVAWEKGPETVGEEYRRKVRIAAGAAQSLIRGNGVPANCPPEFWLVWASHKLLRWMSPVVGLLMALVALATPWNWLSRMVLAGVAAVSALAGLRWAMGRPHPLLDAPFYFLFGQVAVLAGLWRGVRGTQSVLWAKANR